MARVPEPALYLYGISRAPVKPPKISSPGIDGNHPVQAFACADFVCWISVVERGQFTEEMNRNMDNLEWLALHGVRHQQVVAEVAAKVTVVPARFGTVFSSEQALAKNVQGRKSGLNRVFTRISDAEEWGVKVFAEERPTSKVIPGIRTGKEYLQAKAAQAKKKPTRDDAGLQELEVALKAIATDSAPTGKISGAQSDLMWQATFLVPRGQRKEWDQALREFVRRWSGSRRIEVNGPWPPYSFVADAE